MSKKTFEEIAEVHLSNLDTRVGHLEAAKELKSSIFAAKVVKCSSGSWLELEISIGGKTYIARMSNFEEVKK